MFVCLLACARDGKPGNAGATPPSSAAAPATTSTSTSADTTAPRDLASTNWRLVEIQSMGDAQQPIRPDDPAKYTIAFDSEGGHLVMRLDCNRASGLYEDKPNADKRGGNIIIAPLAMTRAYCPPPSLGDRIARDMAYVRSYRFANGRLSLTLMADGRIYIWERITLAPRP